MSGFCIWRWRCWDGNYLATQVWWAISQIQSHVRMYVFSAHFHFFFQTNLSRFYEWNFSPFTDLLTDELFITLIKFCYHLCTFYSTSIFFNYFCISSLLPGSSLVQLPHCFKRTPSQKSHPSHLDWISINVIFFLLFILNHCFLHVLISPCHKLNQFWLFFVSTVHTMCARSHSFIWIAHVNTQCFFLYIVFFLFWPQKSRVREDTRNSAKKLFYF